MPGLEEDTLLKQEIHCHNCDKYVQFDIDVSLNGNHILNCPNCDHEHCRVVKNGKITGERWDARNGQNFYVAASSVTYTTNSMSATASNSTYYTSYAYFSTGTT